MPEKLQDITIADAICEGVFYNEPAFARTIMRDIYNQNLAYAIANFAVLWNEQYVKRGYPFESNPWVWKYVIVILVATMIMKNCVIVTNAIEK